MSRWDTLSPVAVSSPQNSEFGMSQVVQYQGIQPPPGGEQEVFQHGSIGDWVGSTQDGLNSSFIKCVYKAKDAAPNEVVTLLCEKIAGCCQNGCCPKDQYWMAGLFVLLGFVLLIFVVGACLMIICYQRSKSKQRRQEKEVFENSGYGSQMGMYPPPPGSYPVYPQHEMADRY
ncbi:hypothetical protein QR680_005756 [Steinernema hermaphroditum]|uniref:CX domain-containing protein n=1 Tax=Steinernema hermaphroditum TaxID=289476 RepID=A0AA39HUL4_9BILA|nr:hypothetical protein QR680_005756 [Steinernema hermaphroditum]